MARRIAAFLLVALGIAAVQAQADFKGALEKNGFKLAAALFDIANLTKPLSKPGAVYTVLVPNDAAIQTFLKQMGLTVDDLKKRPLLAKELAGQHIILKHNVRPAELFANGPARIVATATGKPNDLLFTRGADGTVRVSDVQGHTAKVGKSFFIDSKKTGHGIDKVLMPDTVFTSFQNLCSFRPLTLKTFCNAVIYAGLNSTLHADKVDATVFVPNNQAFAKAIDLSGGEVPPVAKAAEILKYHVVAGYNTLAHGLATSFKNGAPDQTLLTGQALTVDYQRATPASDSSRKLAFAKAAVKTSSGQTVEVIRPNVHVGTAIVHGVGSVLLPGAATPAAKPAAAAAATPAATPAKTGRKLSATRNLLDFGWGMSAGPTAEGDAAAADISNAVNGDESVASASAQSQLGAEQLSVPGDYDQVDDGVTSW